DENDVTAAPHDRAVDSDRIEDAAGRSVPLTRLAVFGKRRIEDFSILLRRDDVANVAPKVVSKLSRGRYGYELLVRLSAKIPSRKSFAGKLALPMPRRHEKHQSIDLASLNALQLLGDQLVMPRSPIPRERQLSERDQAARRRSQQQLALARPL